MLQEQTFKDNFGDTLVVMKQSDNLLLRVSQAGRDLSNTVRFSQEDSIAVRDYLLELFPLEPVTGQMAALEAAPGITINVAAGGTLTINS